MEKKIIKFETPDCQWCKVATPHIKAFVEENGYEYEESDPTADPTLAIEHEIMSVPAVVVLTSEGVERKLVGFNDIMAYINE